MLQLILLAVTGTVTATTSRWSGDVIVTEAQVRDGSGATRKVVQLGGSVGGLGMLFSQACPRISAYVPDLTLDGLRIIWERATPRLR